MESVLLVGAGGYGTLYARELLKNQNKVHFEGIVDPYVDKAEAYEELMAAGIPMYEDMEAFYAEHAATWAVISTPIMLHCEQVKTAFAHGSHVLVEKPIAATSDLAREMIRARDESGLCLAVGYQWCYEKAMVQLKRDINAGRWGKPLRMKTLVLWPRDKVYYKRGSGWAGKKYDAKGRPIFDSVASNATAHYLMNMLWLAGEGFGGARVETMQAQTARANQIETFDTVTLRATLQTGTEIFFAASHAVSREELRHPKFEIEFENGTVWFDWMAENRIHGVLNGQPVDYGEPVVHDVGIKLWAAMEIPAGGDVTCPAEAALCHTLAIEMLPEAEVMQDWRLDGELVWVPGLAEKLTQEYEAF